MTRLPERLLLDWIWWAAQVIYIWCIIWPSIQSTFTLHIVLVSKRCHLQAWQSRSWILLPLGNNQVGGGRVFRIDSGQKEGGFRTNYSSFGNVFFFASVFALPFWHSSLYFCLSLSPQVWGIQEDRKLPASPKTGSRTQQMDQWGAWQDEWHHFLSTTSTSVQVSGEQL